MVSGFLTSPCDQARIWSAVASAIVIRADSFTSCMQSLASKFRQQVVSVSSASLRHVRLGDRGAQSPHDRPNKGLGSVAGGFPGGVFLVGAPFGPRQVDAEGFGGAEGVLVELADLDLLARLVHDADVEAEGLHLL